MDNQELRQLCEQIAGTGNGYDPAYAPLARSCLRLLQENEAMRVVVEAAKPLWVELSDAERSEWFPEYLEKYDALGKALFQLPPEAK